MTIQLSNLETTKGGVITTEITQSIIEDNSHDFFKAKISKDTKKKIELDSKSIGIPKSTLAGEIIEYAYSEESRKYTLADIILIKIAIENGINERRGE